MQQWPRARPVPNDAGRDDDTDDLLPPDSQNTHSDTVYAFYDFQNTSQYAAEHPQGDPYAYEQTASQTLNMADVVVGSQLGHHQSGLRYSNTLPADITRQLLPDNLQELPSGSSNSAQRSSRGPSSSPYDAATPGSNLPVPLSSTSLHAQGNSFQSQYSFIPTVANSSFTTSDLISVVPTPSNERGSDTNRFLVLQAMQTVGQLNTALEQNMARVPGLRNRYLASVSWSIFDMSISSFRKHMHHTHGWFNNTLQEAVALVHLAWASALIFHRTDANFLWDALIENMRLWALTIADEADQPYFDAIVHLISSTRPSSYVNAQDWGDNVHDIVESYGDDQVWSWLKDGEVARQCLRLVERIEQNTPPTQSSWDGQPKAPPYDVVENFILEPLHKQAWSAELQESIRKHRSKLRAGLFRNMRHFEIALMSSFPLHTSNIKTLCDRVMMQMHGPGWRLYYYDSVLEHIATLSHEWQTRARPSTTLTHHNFDDQIFGYRGPSSPARTSLKPIAHQPYVPIPSPTHHDTSTEVDSRDLVAGQHTSQSTHITIPTTASHASGAHTATSSIHDLPDPLKCHYPGCEVLRYGPHRKTNMRKHVIKKHEDHAKFICGEENCDRQYETRDSLKRHTKLKHTGVPVPEA